jgi:hypothetical protein
VWSGSLFLFYLILHLASLPKPTSILVIEHVNSSLFPGLHICYLLWLEHFLSSYPFLDYSYLTLPKSHYLGSISTPPYFFSFIAFSSFFLVLHLLILFIVESLRIKHKVLNTGTLIFFFIKVISFFCSGHNVKSWCLDFFFFFLSSQCMCQSIFHCYNKIHELG